MDPCLYNSEGRTLPCPYNSEGRTLPGPGVWSQWGQTSERTETLVVSGQQQVESPWPSYLRCHIRVLLEMWYTVNMVIVQQVNRHVTTVTRKQTSSWINLPIIQSVVGFVCINCHQWCHPLSGPINSHHAATNTCNITTHLARNYKANCVTWEQTARCNSSGLFCCEYTLTLTVSCVLIG